MTISVKPSIPAQNCCTATQERSFNGIQVLEKVSAVALGFFSATASPLLFGASFITGIFIGMTQETTADSDHSHGSACSSGFIEQITGIKAPPIIGLLSNLFMTYCHIDHHTQFVVPVIGVHLGIWAGNFVKDSLHLRLNIC